MGMATIVKRGSTAAHGDEWGVTTDAGTVWFRWFHAAADYRDALARGTGEAVLAALVASDLTV